MTIKRDRIERIKLFQRRVENGFCEVNSLLCREKKRTCITDSLSIGLQQIENERTRWNGDLGCQCVTYVRITPGVITQFSCSLRNMTEEASIGMDANSSLAQIINANKMETINNI